MKPLKFVKSRFIIVFISNIALLLTVGVMFPPLALICCNVYAQTREAYSDVDRFFAQRTQAFEIAHTDNAKIAHLDVKLGRVSHVLSQLLSMLFSLVVAYYAFFIFDILGDLGSVSWSTTRTVMLMLIVVPVSLMLLNEVRRYYAVGIEVADSLHYFCPNCS